MFWNLRNQNEIFEDLTFQKEVRNIWKIVEYRSNPFRRLRDFQNLVGSTLRKFKKKRKSSSNVLKKLYNAVSLLKAIKIEWDLMKIDEILTNNSDLTKLLRYDRVLMEFQTEALENFINELYTKYSLKNLRKTTVNKVNKLRVIKLKNSSRKFNSYGTQR